MSNVAKKIGIVALALSSVVALSGCGEIVVDSPNGQGTCGGDAVSLVTSQDALGEVLTIEYTGPQTAGLFYAPGVYWDNLATVDPALAGNAMSSGFMGDSFDIVKLDTTGPGWETTGSAATWNASFTGSVQTLLNGYYFFDLYDAFLGGVVAVDCDGTNTTRTVTALGADGLNGDGIVPNFSFAVAQTLAPNNLVTSPLEVVSSATTTTGATATLTYSPELLAQLGTFIPDVPGTILVVPRVSGLTPDSLRNLWLHFALNGSGGTPGPQIFVDTANPDGSVNAIISDGADGPMPDGDYLIAVPMVNLPSGNATPDSFKMAWGGFTYSHDAGGLSMTNLTLVEETAPEPAAAQPMLADTGVASAPLMIAGAAASGLAFVGAGLVIIGRLRRMRAN